MPFYERGDVRIHYEEVGSGFPLMIIPGGGLNSTVAGLATHPFNPLEEFKDEYRCIAADLRNANGGQSTGPLEIDRPWDAYTDDHLGLMDHLGIGECLVLGFCIGGPFIWNLLQRAPERVVAAVLAQPSGFRPELPDLFYQNNIKGWGPALAERQAGRHHGYGARLPDEYVHQARRLRVHRDARFRACLPDPDPGPAGRRPGAPVRRGHGDRTSGAEGRGEHLPLEGIQGADSAGGAPGACLPPGASPRVRRPLRRFPEKMFPGSPSPQRGEARWGAVALAVGHWRAA